MAATAMAEEAKPGPKFEFHGFVGGSLWAQDAVFNGYGEQIFYVVKQPNQDKLLFGGDARQTRLNFSLAGPTVFGGAVPKAVAEIDFFSALNAIATTGAVAVAPRLRLTYAELNWGTTIFRLGQDNDLVNGSFGVTSVGHIPQTFGYGAGVIGTRHLDAEVFQTVPAGAMKVEMALQVQSQIGGTADGFSGLTTAEAAGMPGVEARLRLIVPKMLDVFVTGHFNKLDRNGQDNAVSNATGLGDSQQTVAGQLGAKLTMGPVTLQGQGYVGKNLQVETGGINQAVPNNVGDVHEWGAWGQLGFNLTPEFSAWAFIGTEKDNYADITAAAVRGQIGNPTGVTGAPTTPAAQSLNTARLQNVTFAGMLRYMDGGYALGLEYVHMHTKYVFPQAVAKVGGVNQARLDGNQLMLSGFYFF